MDNEKDKIIQNSIKEIADMAKKMGEITEERDNLRKQVQLLQNQVLEVNLEILSLVKRIDEKTYKGGRAS